MEVSGTFQSIPINPNNFPSKLWQLVNSPHISSICWDDSGEGILIYQGLFEAEVLWPAMTTSQMDRYFKMTDFNSFLRQLNLYGFKKTCPNRGISQKPFVLMHHFYNPNFKQASPELLVNLKRLTPVYRAKHPAELQEPSQSSRLMPNSPEKGSPVVGTDFVEHQRTPYHQRSHQVKESLMTPKVSQAFVTGHGDPGSEFCHFQMDFPRAHPSHPMQLGSQWAVPAGNLGAFIPHYSQYRFFPPVYQCCIPDALSSNMPYSYAHCGYYPDYSVRRPHFTGQNPNWHADDDDPDPRKRFMSQDTDDSASHLHFTGQNDAPGQAGNCFNQSAHQ